MKFFALSKQRHSQRRDGHAVIELALLFPWIIFLFAGALDMGFYTYALIATQNAARVAAEYTSSHSTLAGDTAGACRYALAEMNSMTNLRGLSSCDTLPLKVVATGVPAGVDGAPATSVSVTYQSGTLIPIPLLTGQLTVTRTVQMRMRDS
jgi:Flp pilus assembly protein TadG